MKKPMLGKRGSVLVETVAALLLVTFSLVINLEVARRAQYEILLQHSAFVFVRARALGATWNRAKQEVELFLERATGVEASGNLMRGLHLAEKRVAKGLVASFHYRYPMFVPFRLPQGQRHHLELTKRCFYPF